MGGELASLVEALQGTEARVKDLRAELTETARPASRDELSEKRLERRLQGACAGWQG